jgi:hypothetical protein
MAFKLYTPETALRMRMLRAQPKYENFRDPYNINVSNLNIYINKAQIRRYRNTTGHSDEEEREGNL